MADLTDTNTTKRCPSLEELREGPPTVSIETAAEYLGVSRPYAYQMVKTGHLPVIWLSHRRKRVPTAKLLRMLEGEDATAGGGAE
jgi:excisionase family DNA binding protein